MTWREEDEEKGRREERNNCKFNLRELDALPRKLLVLSLALSVTVCYCYVIL
jgi:hypothetical protein